MRRHSKTFRIHFQRMVVICTFLVLLGTSIPVRAVSLAKIALPGRAVQFALVGDALYGRSGGSILQINLRDGTRKQLVSALELEEHYDIQEGFSYFVSDDQLYILDPIHGTIGMWSDGSLYHTINLPDFILLDESYNRCLATQGMLWITSQNGVHVIEIYTGKLMTTFDDKDLVYELHPDGMLVLQPQGKESHLKLFSPQGTEMETLAVIPRHSQEMIGVDFSTGYVYAHVGGMICQLEGGQWRSLRAFLHWAAIWNGHLVVSKEERLMLIPLAASDERKLTIRGGRNYYTGDKEFMLAHPGFGLQRIEQRTTSEDVYSAILAQDDTVDLFCLRIGHGVQALIEKGFATSAGLEIMKPDVDRMHPYIQDAITREGNIYAYPAYLPSLQSWWHHQDYEHLPVPKSMMELIDFSMMWVEEGDALPGVCDNGLETPWRQRDYAEYALKQWIYIYADGEIRFNDPALVDVFTRILALPAGGQIKLADEESHSVVVHAAETILFPGYRETYHLIVAPEVVEGAGAAYPAEMMVYIVNPYSQKQQEIETYLQYVAENRMEYQLPWIYKDVVATQTEGYRDKLEALAQEEQAVRDALSQAKPEEMRDLEDKLAHIQGLRDSYMEADIRWDYHPKNLAFFQTHYAPQIRLPLSPLLSTEEGAFPGLWPNLSDLLDQYLAGQLSPHECLARMDALWQLYQKESK